MEEKNDNTGNGTTSPTSLTVAKSGISTGSDFAKFMAALMTDAVSGAVAPNVVNAACNAGGKLLKAVELQQRYGKPNDSGSKVLDIAMRTPLIGEK